MDSTPSSPKCCKVIHIPLLPCVFYLLSSSPSIMHFERILKETYHLSTLLTEIPSENSPLPSRLNCQSFCSWLQLSYISTTFISKYKCTCRHISAARTVSLQSLWGVCRARSLCHESALTLTQGAGSLSGTKVAPTEPHTLQVLHASKKIYLYTKSLAIIFNSFCFSVLL